MPPLMSESVGHDFAELRDIFDLPIHNKSCAEVAAVADVDHSTGCTSCGVKTTAGLPVCFSCMMGSDEPIRLVSSERKRSRADIDPFTESLPTLGSPSSFLEDDTDGSMLVRSLSNISDSLSETLSESENSPKRRRSSIPCQRKQNLDDIFGTLQEPLTGSIFDVPTRPMFPSEPPISKGECEQEFMFPTPPLRTPIASPTKSDAIPSITITNKATIPTVNVPFKKTAVALSSLRRPSFVNGLSKDERESLEKAGKGAMIIRAAEDLNTLMSQLFTC